MTTITMTTAPFTATTPRLVLGFEGVSDSNNIRHQLANGRTRPEFRQASLRRGTLELLYNDETTSRAAEVMLLAGTYFQLDDGTRPTLDGLNFWVPGTVGRRLDDETRSKWIVSVDFEEVGL